MAAPQAEARQVQAGEMSNMMVLLLECAPIFSRPLKYPSLVGSGDWAWEVARQSRVRAALPVGSYLDIKGHLDIKQVLVLPQVPSHLVFGVSQVVLQLPDGVLQRQGCSGPCFRAGTFPTAFLLCPSQRQGSGNGQLVRDGASHQELGTKKSPVNRDEEAGSAPAMACECAWWWVLNLDRFI